MNKLKLLLTMMFLWLGVGMAGAATVPEDGKVYTIYFDHAGDNTKKYLKRNGSAIAIVSDPTDVSLPEYQWLCVKEGDLYTFRNSLYYMQRDGNNYPSLTTAVTQSALLYIGVESSMASGTLPAGGACYITVGTTANGRVVVSNANAFNKFSNGTTGYSGANNYSSCVLFTESTGGHVVTVNHKMGDKTLADEKYYIADGQTFTPAALSDKGYGVTVNVPAGKAITEDTSFDVTYTQSEALPFNALDAADFSNDAYIYKLTLRSKNMYWNGTKCPLVTTSVPVDAQTANKDKFIIVGNNVTGFAFYNQAADTLKPLIGASGQPNFTTGTATKFILEKNDNGTRWQFRTINSANNYLNDNGGKGYLDYWNSAGAKTDAGSTWTFTAVTTAAKAELLAAISSATAKKDSYGTGIGYYTNFDDAIYEAQAVYDNQASSVAQLTAAKIALEAAVKAALILPEAGKTYKILNAKAAFVSAGIDVAMYSSSAGLPRWKKYTTEGEKAGVNTNTVCLWTFTPNGDGYNMQSFGTKMYINTVSASSATAPANPVLLTSLGQGQFNIFFTDGGSPMHPNHHGDSGYNEAEVIKWNGGINDPSAWKIIEVETPTVIEYTINHIRKDGSSMGSNNIALAGNQKPTIWDTPAYDGYTKDSIVVEGATATMRYHLTSLPFNVSNYSGTNPSITWYTIKLRDRYAYYEVEGSKDDNNTINPQTVITPANAAAATSADKCHWSFEGDEENGFIIRNRAMNEGECLEAPTTENSTGLQASTTEQRWFLERNAGNWYFRAGGPTSENRMNKHTTGNVPYMGTWNSGWSKTDAGSQVFFNIAAPEIPTLFQMKNVANGAIATFDDTGIWGTHTINYAEKQWVKLVPNSDNSGYYVCNAAGDRYADTGPTANEAKWLTTNEATSAGVFTLRLFGGNNNCYSITKKGSTTSDNTASMHCNTTGDRQIVRWNSANSPASRWNFIDAAQISDDFMADADTLEFGYRVGNAHPRNQQAVADAKATLEADKYNITNMNALKDAIATAKADYTTATVVISLDGGAATKEIIVEQARTLDNVSAKEVVYAEPDRGYFTIDAEPVYDESTQKYTQSITSGALPFVTSTEGSEHWYAMYIRPDQKWMLKTAGTDNADVNTSEKTFNANDTELWAIAGDLLNGYKLINKQTGWSKPMTSPDPSTTTGNGADILPKMNDAAATMWRVYKNTDTNVGFWLGYGLKGAKMNRRGNDLAYWTEGADQGSAFVVVEPWTAYVAYSNEMNGTKTKVQAIVDGAENVGKIGYATEQGLENAQDFQTKWAEPAAATTAAQFAQIAAVKALEYPITLPEAGKYIVLKKADDSYLTSGKSFSATEDATTVWYVDEDATGVKRLVSVKGGLYLNGRDFATGTETTTVGAAKFIGANYGCLNIVAGQNGTSDMYLHNGTASLDKGDWPVGSVKTDAGYNWTVEYAPEVTVSVSKAGYASFYTPIALKLTADEGLKAFVATVNGETLSLTTVTDDVIPAGEGVVLRGAQGDYHLQLTTETSAETSILAGVVLPRISTFKSEGYTGDYVLSTGTIGDKSGQVGFFPVRQNEVLKGFKAYLPDEPEETAVRAFSFSFEEMTTAIEAAESRTMEDGVMYNLNGQRVTRANGLVIVNGKRIVVK